MSGAGARPGLRPGLGFWPGPVGPGFLAVLPLLSFSSFPHGSYRTFGPGTATVEKFKRFFGGGSSLRCWAGTPSSKGYKRLVFGNLGQNGLKLPRGCILKMCTRDIYLAAS